MLVLVNCVDYLLNGETRKSQVKKIIKIRIVVEYIPLGLLLKPTFSLQKK